MEKSMARHRGLVVWALGVAAAVLLLSSWGTAWATPAQDVLRQTAPTPTGGQNVKYIPSSTGGSVTSSAGDVVVTLPPGATTKDVSVIYTPMSGAAAPAPAPAGTTFGSTLFTLEAYDDATWMPGITFAKPVTITVKYTAADLATACGSPANFVIQYYNSQTKAWTVLPTTYNAAAMTASAVVDHFSWFALTIKQCQPTGLPVTGSGGLAALPLSWIWGVVSAGGVGLALAGLGLKRR